jgi:hypothetical protein
MDLVYADWVLAARADAPLARDVEFAPFGRSRLVLWVMRVDGDFFGITPFTRSLTRGSGWGTRFCGSIQSVGMTEWV